MSQEVTNQYRCLVVEDQALIAMSIETYLEEAGIAVQSVASIAQAQAWLETNRADVAIVDFMLRDGFATALAADLNRRAIPFVIYSGYPLNQGVPFELRGVPWLGKPTSREELMEAVLTILVNVSKQAVSRPTFLA